MEELDKAMHFEYNIKLLIYENLLKTRFDYHTSFSFYPNPNLIQFSS